MEFLEQYDLAFHYTNQAGLVGILQSNTLWATHFAYLNDSTEIAQIKSRLLQVALEITTTMYSDRAKENEEARRGMEAAGGVEKLAEGDAKAVIEILYAITLGEKGGTTYFQPFITSFCTHKDRFERENGLLSQWRGYGKEFAYAIAFNVKRLTELLTLEAAKWSYDPGYFTDVAYDDGDETFKKEFSDLIASMHDDIPKMLKIKNVNYTALNREFPKNIIRYKHRGFGEEKEIRIVAPPTHHTLLDDMAKAGKADKRPKKEVKFRGFMIPYIELFQGLGRELPIEYIIVGPHIEKELRAQRLRKLLDYSEMKIEVRCSGIPFTGS